MIGTLRMPLSASLPSVVVVGMAFALFAHAQPTNKTASSGGAREKLIGAWHLVHIINAAPLWNLALPLTRRTNDGTKDTERAAFGVDLIAC